MIAASLVLVLGASASAPPADEIGFRFRRTDGWPSGEGIPAEVTLGGRSARADLLVDDGDLPRWRWVDGGALERGRIVLRAPAHARALLVFRRASRARGYELEGPFRWPAAPRSLAVHPLPRRTLRGVHPRASGAEVHLVGSSEEASLCETDPAGRWQCLAVPPDFAGRVVACDGGYARAAAETRSDLPDEVPMRELGASAILRIAPTESAGGPVSASVRVLRAITSGGGLLTRDPSSEVAGLGAGLFWLEVRSDSGRAVVEASAPGFATQRLSFSDLQSACAPPTSLDLVPATPLTGTVHEASDRPVSDATVLVQSAVPDGARGVLADVITGENGAFEVRDLESGRYRVRACHARFGCGTAVSVPGEPLTITLDGGPAFVGRVLSSAGVPEPSARVRIVPSPDAARTGDRAARMPLETAAGSDGRFRVSVPVDGDFLLEFRAESGGVARLAVRRSPLSPPLTDVGDVRVPEALELTVRVVGCGGGVLSMSGPLGGQTSLPTLARFPLDGEGSSDVRLPEGGAWTAWATCGGANVALDPSLLPDVAAFATAAIEVRFEPVGALGDQSAGRPK